jgi:hypothetical protein
MRGVEAPWDGAPAQHAAALRAAVVRDEGSGRPIRNAEDGAYGHFTSGASGMKSHCVRLNESNWVRFVFSADSISTRV